MPTIPPRVWRDGINAFFETLRVHLSVALAGVAATATNAEIRELWSTFMQKWIDRTAAVIAAERARGAAPDTVPAVELAAALNCMNERTMFASYSATNSPSLPRAAALDTLVHIWVTSIYGAIPAELVGL